MGWHKTAYCCQLSGQIRSGKQHLWAGATQAPRQSAHCNDRGPRHAGLQPPRTSTPPATHARAPLASFNASTAHVTPLIPGKGPQLLTSLPGNLPAQARTQPVHACPPPTTTTTTKSKRTHIPPSRAPCPCAPWRPCGSRGCRCCGTGPPPPPCPPQSPGSGSPAPPRPQRWTWQPCSTQTKYYWQEGQGVGVCVCVGRAANRVEYCGTVEVVRGPCAEPTLIIALTFPSPHQPNAIRRVQ
jgi:hypothetical protein